MRIDVITIFPDLFPPYFNESLLKRAQTAGLLEFRVHNLRDYSNDRHQKVDDRPYGGGPGMILKAEPIIRCLTALSSSRKRGSRKNKKQNIRVIALDPAGKQLTQTMAKRLAKYDQLVLLCGRYEGFDARVAKLVDEELSLGDFVLAGGELPALVMVEAIARHVPGVVGHPDALREETFAGDLTATEYPQYTRPAEFRPAGKRGPVWKVPKVLLSGDHKKIASWRQRQTARSSK